MFKYYFFALNATLSDYLTLMDFLAKRDVEKGYVCFDHGTGMACLGIQMYEDSDLEPREILAQYACIVGDGGFDSNDELDQPFQIDNGLFLSMLSCDLIQTKNLAVERGTIAKRNGIQLQSDKIVVEKSK